MATKSEVNAFINKISKLVIAEVKDRKNNDKKWVLPSVCIAQAALETGWGTSNIMVKANAYFGIKATKSWEGKVYSTKTKECYDGVTYTTITDLFRAYESLKESITDYYDLITKSSRYKDACNITDAKSCITAIKDGGYSTAPSYVSSVMSIIEKYELTKYDTVASLRPIEEVAKDVISGKYGNGDERKKKLESEGYIYEEVQEYVTKLIEKDKPKVSYFKKYTGKSVSIIDALSSIGCDDTSKSYRAKIALVNSIVSKSSSYVGSTSQNESMLKLLKEGKLIKP